MCAPTSAPISATPTSSSTTSCGATPNSSSTASCVSPPNTSARPANIALGTAPRSSYHAPFLAIASTKNATFCTSQRAVVHTHDTSGLPRLSVDATSNTSVRPPCLAIAPAPSTSARAYLANASALIPSVSAPHYACAITLSASFFSPSIAAICSTAVGTAGHSSARPALFAPLYTSASTACLSSSAAGHSSVRAFTVYATACSSAHASRLAIATTRSSSVRPPRFAAITTASDSSI